ncbi:MAG: TonB-dependent receptor [Pseudomonadota bacterium]
MKYRRTSHYCVALTLVAVHGSVYAQGSEEERDSAIEEIVVKGELLDAAASAFSTASFDTDSIRKLEVPQLQDMLDYVSGLSIRRFGLAGVADAITIRGFGGGGHGGDLGVVLDGVPLNEAMSHADGYVDLNVIVPLEVRNLTVFKGPVSALYGNFNRAGLLKIDTRASGSYRQLDVSAGSDGIFDVQGALGTAVGENQQINAAIQHAQGDGFRPQSENDRLTLAGTWRASFETGTELALSGRWHTAESDNASYLPEELYLTDPYGIDPGVQNDGAEKDFGTLRIDLNQNIGEDSRLLTFAYRTVQDFSRWFSRPRGDQWAQREETYDRDVIGVGSSLNTRTTLAGVAVNLVAGVEAFRETTHFEFYDNLDNRVRVEPAINDRETELSSASGFLELQAEVHPLFQPSLGLRYDRFSGECELQGPETGTEPCEELNDLDNLAPKLGFRSAITDELVLRASFSEGFSLPNGWVKYQSQAANLDPVTYRQYEIGLAWQPLPGLLLDIAAFQLDSDGEVRTAAPAEFENFGETERRGIEASMDWTPIDTLTICLVYNQTDAEVVRNDNPALVGNDVSGVADSSGTVRAVWSFLPGWQIDTDWRFVGEFPLNGANTFYSERYDLLNLGLAYSGSESWRAYLQVNNVTDEVFAPSQFVIGGPVYGTGAPRQFRVGVQFNL